MKIIILDLEWNSAYSKNETRFINEIIEFGAVMLDDNLQEISRFQCFVRSRLTKRLRSQVKGLTNITNDQMRSGIMLEDAVSRFAEWAGADTLTLSWSNTDLHVLIDNLHSFLGLDKIPFIYLYADMQKFVQDKLGITSNQISLAHAAQTLGVDDSEFAAHRALGDCLCSAEILRKTSLDGIEKYILDTNKNNFYERMLFKVHYIKDLNCPEIDKTKMTISCPVCGKTARRMSKWKNRNNSFRAEFCCKCGQKFIGTIKYRVTFDGIKTIKGVYIPQTENSDIIEKENQNV